MARQVGCLFPEIFATVFGIKSLNNLLFNKFKCKNGSGSQLPRERAVQRVVAANKFFFFLPPRSMLKGLTPPKKVIRTMHI